MSDTVRAVVMPGPQMSCHQARFRWRELITREYELAEAGQALKDMARLSVVKALIRPPRVD